MSCCSIKTYFRTREMAPWVKCLPRKCEGLSSDPQHTHKAGPRMRLWSFCSAGRQDKCDDGQLRLSSYPHKHTVVHGPIHTQAHSHACTHTQTLKKKTLLFTLSPVEALRNCISMWRRWLGIPKSSPHSSYVDFSQWHHLKFKSRL